MSPKNSVRLLSSTNSSHSIDTNSQKKRLHLHSVVYISKPDSIYTIWQRFRLSCNRCSYIPQYSLQWCHNGRDGVSNHQPHHCLHNCLFWRRSKKSSNLRVTGVCVRGIHRWPHKWPVTREMFPFDDVIICGSQASHSTHNWVEVKFITENTRNSLQYNTVYNTNTNKTTQPSQ